MAIPFEAVRGDFNLQADFANPVFQIFRDLPAPALASRLFKGLGKYGLRLGDMKFTFGDGTVGDVETSCYLFNFAFLLKVHVDRVEIQVFDTSRIERQALESAAVDTLTAVSEHVHPEVFRAFSLNVGVHGRLKDLSTTDFLNGFVKHPPEALSQPLGCGMVFYYGPEGNQFGSSVTLDVSGQLEKGLFIRQQVTWDAAQVDIRNLPSLATEREAKVYGALGLVV